MAHHEATKWTRSHGKTSLAPRSSTILLNCVEVRHRGNVKHAVGSGGCAANGRAEFETGKELLVSACCEDVEVPTARAEIDLAIGHIGRSPDFALDLVRPKSLAGLRIHAMEHAPAVGDKHQSIG